MKVYEVLVTERDLELNQKNNCVAARLRRKSSVKVLPVCEE